MFTFFLSKDTWVFWDKATINTLDICLFIHDTVRSSIPIVSLVQSEINKVSNTSFQTQFKQTDVNIRVTRQAQAGSVNELMFLNSSIPIILDMVKKWIMHRKRPWSCKHFVWSLFISQWLEYSWQVCNRLY